MRLRNAVLKKLKDEHPSVHAVFHNILNTDLYKKAQEYRTAASHGSSPNSVKDTVLYEKDIISTFPVLDDNGMPVLDAEGKPITKQMKARKISFGIGKYTPTSVIFQNMQDYAKLSAEKIHEIMTLMREKL